MRKLNRKVWPYQVIVKDVTEISVWCNDYIGLRFKDWYGYATGDGRRIFAFRDQDTLLVFKLKWGSNERN